MKYLKEAGLLALNKRGISAALIVVTLKQQKIEVTINEAFELVDALVVKGVLLSNGEIGVNNETELFEKLGI